MDVDAGFASVDGAGIRHRAVAADVDTIGLAADVTVIADRTVAANKDAGTAVINVKGFNLSTINNQTITGDIDGVGVLSVKSPDISRTGVNYRAVAADINAVIVTGSFIVCPDISRVGYHAVAGNINTIRVFIGAISLNGSGIGYRAIAVDVNAVAVIIAIVPGNRACVV